MTETLAVAPLPSSDVPSTPATSALPVQNPYPSRTPSNVPSGASNSTTASDSGSTSSTSSSSGSLTSSTSATSSSSTSSVSSIVITSGGTTLVVPANTQPSPNAPTTQFGQTTSGNLLPQASGGANSAAGRTIGPASLALPLIFTPLIALLLA
ncbi:hypothetical protein CALVIDRAFT_140380 [Calocera viscosa TUFC12733]|uniref:Uncharacterized protein n=1 Tax=Calocera viscosa (strain TUFC12733) TaxID=1330018 RepID=A0A167M2L5_CALVF|nr:hypothetical protein CALVIDRAFT_140380 [Calocera viscosa TUFC12733]